MKVSTVKMTWYETEVTVLYCLDRWFCHLIHLYEPLLFNHWLYRSVTAVMRSYVMLMVLDTYKVTAFF